MNTNLGTNWFVGRFGLYSGCTINNMWGKPVPKYAPSVWWCREDFGVYTSIHFGQYDLTIASPGTSESPTTILKKSVVKWKFYVVLSKQFPT